MSADEIIKIIDALPIYIQYIYPGYLTIYIYYFFRAHTLKDAKAIIVKSIALSYIYKIILDRFTNFSPLTYNACLVVIAVFIAYIAYTITKLENTTNILNKIGIKTSFSNDEIDEIEKNAPNGTWLCIYLKNTNIVYEGSLIAREMESDKRKYIAISQYRKYQLNEAGKPISPYIEQHDKNKNEKAIIYFDEILRIEIRDLS